VELTNEDVADILALLDSLPYDELDLRTDRFRLTLRRTPTDGWTEERQDLVDPVPLGSGTPVTPDHDISVMSESGQSGEAGLVAVVAPLPGTFYRSPRPGAAPFVEVGDAVTADTVVAIVETMKLMNSVPAGTPGRVALIRAANGDFTQLGATLMLIEP